MPRCQEPKDHQYHAGVPLSSPNARMGNPRLVRTNGRSDPKGGWRSAIFIAPVMFQWQPMCQGDWSCSTGHCGQPHHTDYIERALQGHVAVGMWQPPSCSVNQSNNTPSLANMQVRRTRSWISRSYHRRVCCAMAGMGILAFHMPELDSRSQNHRERHSHTCLQGSGGAHSK